MSSYDFRSLSPTDLEDLVRDLLQGELNLVFESFARGRDGGIDLRHSSAQIGKIIVQAKHYRDSGYRKLLSNLSNERPKVDRLKPQRYILATTVSLTPDNKAEIAQLFAPHLDQADILGAEQLNNLLGRHPKVEQQHFKLWMSSTPVLQRILHNATYVRSTDEAQRIERAVRIFAMNRSVSQALGVLDKHRLLIVSGGPGVGKTTLARLIAWLHMQDSWELFAVESFDEALDVYDVTKRQIFFFDDFLGQIRLTPESLQRDDAKLMGFISRVQGSPNSRFVLTSREYILNQASIASEKISNNFVEVRKYILDISTYTREVKAKILYNHIYFSGLSSAHRGALLSDDFFIKIIDHKNFSPRLIEFLITSPDIGKVAADRYRDWIVNNLDYPQLIWSYAFREHLSRKGRSLVATLFFLPERTSVTDLERGFWLVYRAEAQDHRFSTDHDDFTRAMRETSNSFIYVANATVSFVNPSIRDFLDNALIGTSFPHYVLQNLSESRQAALVWDYLAVHAAKHPVLDGNMTSGLAKAATSLVELPEQHTRLDAQNRKLQSKEGLSLLARLDLVLRWWLVTKSSQIAICANALSRRIRIEPLHEPEVETAIDLYSTVSGIAYQDLPNYNEVLEALRHRMFERLASDYEYLDAPELNMLTVFLDKNPSLGSERAIEIVNALIDGLIGNASDVINEIGSSMDLDQFESELDELTSWSGSSSRHLSNLILERRIELEEKEAHEDGYDGYEGADSDRPGALEDAGLRSMFSTLDN